MLMHPDTRTPLEAVRENMAACMQCGTCSATCPNAPFMDLTPRALWRLAQLGRLEEIAASRTFWMCSACYACTLRCPRGLPLTRSMADLKRAVAGSAHGAFYRAFMDNALANGRVQESTLMARYLLSRRSAGLALSFAPLGLKLASKGKLHPPSTRHKGVLGPLLARVREMEARP